VRHYEPPEVTWLGPELEVGVELECRPLELELELELPELELELPELEDDELELPELEDDELEEPESEGVGDEPVDVSVLWVEPGRARASAPAVTTLASVTAVVVERTLLRPRSLAATASRIPSRCALLITLILRSGTPNSLYEPSWQPLSSAVRFPSPGVKLPSEDEGCLKAA
jgi:hypothetical protein